VGYRRKVFDIAGMKNENKALALTPQEFVQMGAGSVAYVKAINLRGRSAPLPASPAAPPRRQAASAHRRRRLTPHADRLEGRGDRQRLGTRIEDRQPALRRVWDNSGTAHIVTGARLWDWRRRSWKRSVLGAKRAQPLAA
jgi:hypothetical protein